MTGAVAAGGSGAPREAVVGDDDGEAYVYVGLLLRSNGAYGASGAYFAATSAFWSAEATLEGHLGLHQCREVVAGAQHLVGAFADA